MWGGILVVRVVGWVLLSCQGWKIESVEGRVGGCVGGRSGGVRVCRGDIDGGEGRKLGVISREGVRGERVGREIPSIRAVQLIIGQLQGGNYTALTSVYMYNVCTCNGIFYSTCTCMYICT